MGGGHRVHVVGFAVAGFAAVKILAIPAGHTLFDKTFCGRNRLIAGTKDDVGSLGRSQIRTGRSRCHDRSLRSRHHDRSLMSRRATRCKQREEENETIFLQASDHVSIDNGSGAASQQDLFVGTSLVAREGRVLLRRGKRGRKNPSPRTSGSLHELMRPIPQPRTWPETSGNAVQPVPRQKEPADRPGAFSGIPSPWWLRQRDWCVRPPPARGSHRR